MGLQRAAHVFLPFSPYEELYLDEINNLKTEVCLLFKGLPAWAALAPSCDGWDSSACDWDILGNSPFGNKLAVWRMWFLCWFAVQVLLNLKKTPLLKYLGYRTFSCFSLWFLRNGKWNLKIRCPEVSFQNDTWKALLFSKCSILVCRRQNKMLPSSGNTPCIFVKWTVFIYPHKISELWNLNFRKTSCLGNIKTSNFNQHTWTNLHVKFS